MSQRFFRCPHCGLPHAESDTVCPALGMSIERRRVSPSSSPPPSPSSPPSPSAPPHPSSSPIPAATPVSLPPPAPSSRPPMDAAYDKRSLVGTVVDGAYLIKSVLGQGGMATVYDAEQTPIGRPVALKVLPIDQADKKEASRRFLQEARAAASLSHPNICQVFNFGALEDGSPYYVMERLVGEPLSERLLREKALPFLDILDIATQVLAGLGTAHKKGVVHRDIKPDNVFLVRREGKAPMVKLLDFGVSKMVRPAGEMSGDDTTQLTRTGIVMGTPFYMAPEQAFGDRNFDARVDLWSTGVILYQAISGKRPFTGASYTALLSAIMSETPRPVRDHRPGTPMEFDLMLTKALAKSRDARYQNALDFMRDLQHLRMRVLELGLYAKKPPASGSPIKAASPPGGKPGGEPGGD